jgi:hypothetical protein
LGRFGPGDVAGLEVAGVAEAVELEFGLPAIPGGEASVEGSQDASPNKHASATRFLLIPTKTKENVERLPLAGDEQATRQEIRKGTRELGGEDCSYG